MAFGFRKYEMFRTKNVDLYYAFIGHVHDLLLFLIYLTFWILVGIPYVGDFDLSYNVS